MNLCCNCEEWYLTKPFMGNCPIHHWKEDKYSQDADAGDCPDFKDRYAKYEGYQCLDKARR
jgi:hypothetical protein